MDEKHLERKKLRLQEYDYRSVGHYYVTVCTRERECLLRSGAQGSSAAGRSGGLDPLPPLSRAGLTAERYLLDIPNHYPNVTVDKYVIMPNHIHAVIMIEPTGVQRSAGLSSIIKGWKEAVTKALGERIWQRSYYDHVIRNEADYLRICRYIEENPAKWMDDEYYG